MRKFLSGLIVGLVITSIPVGFAVSRLFSDVEAGSWYEKAVNTVASMGVVSGFPDGSFQPSKNASRAEIAVMFARFKEYMDKNYERIPIGEFGGVRDFTYYICQDEKTSARIYYLTWCDGSMGGTCKDRFFDHNGKLIEAVDGYTEGKPETKKTNCFYTTRAYFKNRTEARFSEANLTICPDAWHQNDEPQAYDPGEPGYRSPEERQSYIKNGIGRNLNEFDNNWVAANCNLTLEISE